MKLKHRFKKLCSRAVASAVVVAMLFVMLPVSAFSAFASASSESSQAGSTDYGLMNEDMSITGTNSFGAMLSNTIQTYNDSVSLGNTEGYIVSDVVVSGNTAKIEYSVLKNCMAVIAFYTEDGLKMITSESTVLHSDESVAQVTIRDTLPEYFLIKAFLINLSTNNPLCDPFTSSFYTQAIQELKSKTIDDFAGQSVLNLDESRTTNFAVYDDEVIISNKQNNKNVYDENASSPDNGKYVFRNADSTLISLKKGDIFSYTKSATDVIIIKILKISIEENGGQHDVVLFEDKNIELDDVFDYVKIENNGKIKSYEFDDSVASEEITPINYTNSPAYNLNRQTNYSAEFAPKNYNSVDISASFDLIKKAVKFEKKIESDNDHYNYSVNLKLDIFTKISFSIKVYLAGNSQYIETKLDLEASVVGKATGELSAETGELFYVGFSPVAGVYVGIAPKFKFSFSGEAEVKLSVESTVGMRYSNSDGFSNISSPPKVDFKLAIEGTVFVGLVLEPSIKIISDNIAKASLEGSAGFEITGSYEQKATTEERESIHTCDKCIKGDIGFKLSLKAKVEFAKISFASSELSFTDDGIKICDWYYSVDHNELKFFATCPYNLFRTRIFVLDIAGNRLYDAAVYYDSNSEEDVYVGRTDSDGIVKTYLAPGNYKFTAVYDESYKTVKAEVKEKPTDVDIDIILPTEEPVIPPGSGNIVDSGKCGANLKWDLYESGLLIIDGTGNMTNYGPSDDCPGWKVSKWNKGHGIDVRNVMIYGAQNVGKYAFWELYELESVYMAKSVRRIEECAFASNSLSEVIISPNVSFIGYYAFGGNNLTEIHLPKALSDIGQSAFSGLHLESISIDPNNTHFFTQDGILYTKDMKKLIICPAKKASINNLPDQIEMIMDEAFCHCDSITSITLPESIVSIGNEAFLGCSSLKTINLPNSITNIGYSAFLGCNKLETIIVPSSLTVINSTAFAYCEKLSKIYLPLSVTQIHSDTFKGCSGLQTVYYEGSSDEYWGISVIDQRASLSFYKLSHPNDELFSAEVYYNFSWSNSTNTQTQTEDAHLSEQSQPNENSNTEPNEGPNSQSNNESSSDDPIIPSSGGSGSTLLNGSIHTDLRTASFNNLDEDTVYVIAVMKKETEENVFDNSNLLYIEQMISDSQGKLSFKYEPKVPYENPVIKLYGMYKYSIKEGDISVSNLIYNGETQKPEITVKKFGFKLYPGADYIISGTTKAVEPGSYDFTVTGIGEYKGSVRCSFEIVSAEIKLNLNDISMLVGTKFKPKSFLYPSDSGETVTWRSANESIATVSSTGEITAVAKGKTVITAKTQGGKSDTIKVSVVDRTKPTTSITLKQSTQTLVIKRSKMNPTATLSASIKGGSGGKTWYSDDINVVTVTKTGKLMAIAAGKTNVYCRTEDGTTSEPCQVTVGNYRIDCVDGYKRNMVGNTVYVLEGKNCKLTVNFNNYHYGKLSWKSGNAKIVSVDNYGYIRGLKKGTTNIYLTDTAKNSDSVKVVVVSPTRSVYLNPTRLDIYVGASKTLKATLGTKGSNDPIFWSSDNPSVATVTEKGVIKGIGQGTTKITATTFSGKKTSTVVTVCAKATALEFTETVSALYMNGNTGRFTVKIASPVNSNDTITWSTGNKKILSIVSTSSDGKSIVVKTGAKGTTTVTAKSGSGKKITWKVTSVDRAAESITFDRYSASLYVGSSLTLKAKQILPKGCNDVILWQSSDPAIATVDQNGKVTGKAQGEVTIYANSFGGVRNSVAVTVRTKATSVTLDQTSATVTAGNSVTINVAVSPEGCNDTLTWASSNKKIVTVTPSSDGRSAVITGMKKGTATVTVKTGSGKSKSVKIMVG